MSKGLTELEVFTAADTIAASGEVPSMRAVRAKLGTGSFATIQKHLQTWRKNRRQTVVTDYQLPPALIHSFAEEIDRQVDEATSSIRAELTVTRSDMDDHVEQGLEFEGQILELTSSIEALERERDEYKTMATARLDEIKRLEAQLSHTHAASEETRTQLATAQLKCESLGERLAAFQKEAEAHASETKTRLHELQQTMESSKASQQNAEREAAIAEEKYKAQHEKALDLKSQLDDLRAQLLDSRKEIQDLRSELKETHQNHAQDSDKLREQIALERERNAELERDALVAQISPAGPRAPKLIPNLAEEVSADANTRQ